MTDDLLDYYLLLWRPKQSLLRRLDWSHCLDLALNESLLNGILRGNLLNWNLLDGNLLDRNLRRQNLLNDLPLNWLWWLSQHRTCWLQTFTLIQHRVDSISAYDRWSLLDETSIYNSCLLGWYNNISNTASLGL